MPAPTKPQVDFVRSLQTQLRLPDAGLDDHCRRRFGQPFERLTRKEVSELLDELQGWEGIPAEVQRAMGQLDLLTL